MLRGLVQRRKQSIQIYPISLILQKFDAQYNYLLQNAASLKGEHSKNSLNA